MIKALRSPSIRLGDQGALLLKRLQRFANRRPADLESFRQVQLREQVSRFEDVIQNRIADFSDDRRRRLFDLGGLIVYVLNRRLVHRESFGRGCV